MGAAMDLFEHHRLKDTAARAPLADRMRPRDLDEFVGQGHIVGPGRLLRRAIEADQLSSLIFTGPPGTGKTTLARIIANTTDAHFIAINAVLAGVKDLRAAVAEATERRGMHGQRTILFVDEVHRFNKAQQDALLPWVENGTVVLVGATTENPYFEVNKALVSRSRVFQLRPLEPDDLRAVARAALADAERGYGRLDVVLHDDALEHLIEVAGGDARGVLNALELAVETTAPDDHGRIVISLAVAEESIQRRAVLYDKEGDAHFDTVSAFIKSLRGSDPDAALYWLARMVYAGEDPRFILRRMLILAAEDVGLADPAALGVVRACAAAFDYVGLPEGQFHLTQAALYLATAPKSNSALAYFDALAAVERERMDDVPAHLKDASRDRDAFGHGAGYQYPHAYRDHWTAQQYLPSSLQGRVFYHPGDQGYEGTVRPAVCRRRDAQLAAMAESSDWGGSEALTFTGLEAGRARDRWLARVTGSAADRLGALRDHVLDQARLERHARVLVLAAGSGLLTWEAVRRAPEGGVWALAPEAGRAEALTALARGLAQIDRPTVLVGEPAELAELLALRGEGALRFDAVIARNARGIVGETAALRAVAGLMAPGARLVLAEPVPGLSARPSSLLAHGPAAPELADAVKAAEARAYGGPPGQDAAAAGVDGYANGGDHAARAEAPPPDPAFLWRPDDLARLLADAGLADVRADVVVERGTLALTPALQRRWFGPGARYAEMLARSMDRRDVEAAGAAIGAMADGRSLPWETATAFLTARRP